MAIFGRRQLQQMLNELGPSLVRSKATDLLRRLENADPDQCLPAEYELALTWGASRLATVEIDRSFGGRNPDFYSPDLLPSGPVAAEIAAVSDETLSGRPIMRRAASIINDACNRMRKGASRHLHYTFHEESGYERINTRSGVSSRYFRRRQVSRKFTIDAAAETLLRGWLKDGMPRGALQLKTDDIDVTIQWRDAVHPAGQVFSSMPSLAHDVKENPLYAVLDAKRKQLQGVPANTRRLVLLGDSGCSLLRDVRPVTSTAHTVSGSEIIQKFLVDSGLEYVAVFTPKRRDEHSFSSFNNPLLWHMYLFCGHETDHRADFRLMQKLCGLLPAPSLHGYQARAWHEQGMLDPQGRGQYLAPIWTGGIGRMKVQISARGLQELLAGRLTQDEFERWVAGEGDLFNRHLSAGRTISAVSLESKGAEADDDYIVFGFDRDAAAAPLSIPGKLKQDP